MLKVMEVGEAEDFGGARAYSMRGLYPVFSDSPRGNVIPLTQLFSLLWLMRTIPETSLKMHAETPPDLIVN